MKLLSKKIMLKEHLIATKFILALVAEHFWLEHPTDERDIFQLGGEALLLTLVHTQSDSFFNVPKRISATSKGLFIEFE